MAKEKAAQFSNLLQTPPPQSDGINHLLVIAINDYHYAPTLANCVDDAEKLVKVLTEKYRFEPEHVTKVYNEAATRGNILKTLAGYSDKVNENDSLLILFSGHGEIYKEEQGYWVPVEAAPGERHQYVAHSEIKTELDYINCFHTFLIVDACFSGALFTIQRNISPGNEARKSRWGLAASHSREVALDGKPGENSPFARYLIKNLRENEADIGIHKLSANVIDDVRRAVQGKQNPVFQPLDVRGHDLGQFVFRLRGQNTFVDPRDGKVYRTVELNGKLWMAQNLDFDVGEGCWYYADDGRIGQVFGRLYTWEAAKKACPSGWHLPTDEEWREMTKQYGGIFEYPSNGGTVAYHSLLEGGESGFAALLGGTRGPGDTFYPLGANGDYWSGTEEDARYAWSYTFNRGNGNLTRNYYDKLWGISCRCMKD